MKPFTPFHFMAIGTNNELISALGSLTLVSERVHNTAMGIFRNNMDEKAITTELEFLFQGNLKNVTDFCVFLRTIATCYYPDFFLCFQNEEIKPQYLTMPSGTVPKPIAEKILVMLDIAKKNTALPSGTTTLQYICTLECLLCCSLEMYDTAILKAKSAIVDFQKPETITFMFLAPVHVPCPCFSQLAAFFIRMNMLQEAQVFINVLGYFESRGYTSAKYALSSLNVILRNHFMDSTSSIQSIFQQQRIQIQQQQIQQQQQLLQQQQQQIQQQQQQIRQQLETIQQTRFLPGFISNWTVENEELFADELESIILSAQT